MSESLSSLARRYADIRDAASQEFRQLRKGGTGPRGREDAAGPGKKLDARRLAAASLDAGVSHATLEKVCYLQNVIRDRTVPSFIRETACDALDEIDAGGAVDRRYQNVRAQLMIRSVEQLVAEDRWLAMNPWVQRRVHLVEGHAGSLHAAETDTRGSFEVVAALHRGHDGAGGAAGSR